VTSKPKIKTVEENPTGLHQRYVLTKADGSPVDDDAVYFVLRLDKYGDDPDHTQFCRDAAREYCKRVNNRTDDEHPLRLVGNELWNLLNDIEGGNVYRQAAQGVVKGKEVAGEILKAIGMEDRRVTKIEILFEKDIPVTIVCRYQAGPEQADAIVNFVTKRDWEEVEDPQISQTDADYDVAGGNENGS